MKSKQNLLQNSNFPNHITKNTSYDREKLKMFVFGSLMIAIPGKSVLNSTVTCRIKTACG